MDEMSTNDTTRNETVIDEMPINDTAMIETAVDKTGVDKTAVNKSSSGVDLLTDVSGDSAVIEVSNSGEAKGESPASSSSIYSPAQSLTETGKKYSAITSFLTLPSKLQEKNGKTKSPGLARVLTSEESLAMLKEKERKKKEEEEEKQKRKKESEKKRLEREALMKRKAEEKAAERQKKKEEKLAEQKERKRQLLEKKMEKGKKKIDLEGKRKQQEKQKIPGKVYPLRHSVSNNEKAKCAYLPENVCSLCSGNYEDDISPDGTLLAGWIQCTSCKLWMHEECAREINGDEISCECGNVLC